MGENIGNEERVNQSSARLRAELSFYKAKCLELERQEWREQELHEEIKSLKLKHEEEKKQLMEQVKILKAFVNDISDVKDGRKADENWKEEKEKYNAEIAALKQRLSQYEQQEKQSRQQRQTADSWFVRVLQEQEAIANERYVKTEEREEEE